MNSKKKTLILIVLFIVLMVGASVLYNSLSADFTLDSLSVEEGVESTDDTTNTVANDSQSSENNGNNSEDSSSSADVQLTQAPNFTVYDIEGNEINLSDFFGKPIIVNFWASWCGPCKMEMPDFDEAYQTYGNDISFLMVNITDGSRETVEIASSFIEESGYSFPVYYDTNYSAAITYSVSSLPTTYFIDADGNLIAHARGAIDDATLQKGINMIYSKE
ncbi:MAG: TlpA family protein disulfide reductase [Lachnospiraceae bacterium]|nr:TlpA family protein disulfide reductase [Lachnospiraceae bacterium]